MAESQKMQMLETVCWLLLALIHLTPALAFFKPDLIQKLYGIDKHNPLFAILHHRAALFLSVFLVLIWAACDVQIRPVAGSIATVSMISFIYIYHKYQQPAQLKRIYQFDLFGLIPLSIAILLHLNNL